MAIMFYSYTGSFSFVFYCEVKSCLSGFLSTVHWGIFFFFKHNDSVLDNLQKFLNYFIYVFYGALKYGKI